MTESKTEIVKRGDSALIEKTFNVDFKTLPTALAAALADLARLANKMEPDDVSLTLDLPAGILKFRSYKRAPVHDD